nr:MAG TPA: hypothetical protein [Caudoviricetes sp.]
MCVCACVCVYTGEPLQNGVTWLRGYLGGHDYA